MKHFIAFLCLALLPAFSEARGVAVSVGGFGGVNVAVGRGFGFNRGFVHSGFGFSHFNTFGYGLGFGIPSYGLGFSSYAVPGYSYAPALAVAAPVCAASYAAPVAVAAPVCAPAVAVAPAVTYAAPVAAPICAASYGVGYAGVGYAGVGYGVGLSSYFASPVFASHFRTFAPFVGIHRGVAVAVGAGVNRVAVRQGLFGRTVVRVRR